MHDLWVNFVQCCIINIQLSTTR